MKENECRELKQEALSSLLSEYPVHSANIASTDARLQQYVESFLDDKADERHNLWEVLAVRKFFRMLGTEEYTFNSARLHRLFSLYERLKFSGLSGRRSYRLTPCQVFMLSCTYGFFHHVNTGRVYNDGDELQETETVTEDGEIYDYRELVTDVHYYIPRKFCKTTMGAFGVVEDFFFGDYNAECYICANTSNQANIAFKLSKDLIHQLDPQEKLIRFTNRLIEWKQGTGRSAKIEALTAGPKAKDGTFASYRLADERGSARYVKEKCDMESLVNVVDGGMGPRREPKRVTTTTAGRISSGPYIEMLESLKNTLVKNSPEDDYQFAFIMEPDEWEKDPEYIFTHPHVWRKVNPHIGITVQADYYERQIIEARKTRDKFLEVVTKDFNMYQSDKVREWIKPSEIMKLQTDMRIDDCLADDGWTVYVGMDFSLGDDLHAQTYLAVRDTSEGSEFFADMDGWITEDVLHNSSIRHLYEKWIEQGWLHLSPGSTLQPDLPINRIIELSDKVVFMRFGYDPYKAKQPINTLSAWLYGEGDDPSVYVRPVRQNYATYNPAVLEIDYMVKSNPPMIRFSANPMWAWEFGNVLLDESSDGMENHKPVKANPNTDGCKVDHVQCLCSALILYDELDGKENVNI